MKGEWLRETINGTVIVFVHGILSNERDCWTSSTGTYWPELLKEENALREVGLYVFSYQTGFLPNDYALNDIVHALREQFKIDNVLKRQRRIIFVCHSMGGLVVRKFVVDQQLHLFKLNVSLGLVLLASPSRGSKYANWLNWLPRCLKTSQSEVLTFSDRNLWLDDLDRAFKNLKEQVNGLPISGQEMIEDTPFAKRRFVRLPRIVGRGSAARYFGDPHKVPNSDHSSIAKPGDRKAHQHQVLCDFVLNKEKESVPRRTTIVYHGTKYNVPGSNDWWTALARDSRRKFYLVGATNKSWIDKDEEQKAVIAESIVSLLEQGGKVRLLSTMDDFTAKTLKFLNEYVRPRLSSAVEDGDGSSENGLMYAVASHTNYNAVVSDDRLILMPTMNTPAFRDTCMVLELERYNEPSVFNNYLADIERCFSAENRQIAWKLISQ